MSDIQDLRTAHQVIESETSFGGIGDDDRFVQVKSTDLLAPADEHQELRQQSATSVDAALRTKQPGLITKIGRGVKSAVDGAINIFVGNLSAM